MTQPNPSAHDAERHAFEVRETARRETFRLARQAGAGIIDRPMYSSGSEPTVRDVEALAGARVARDLELAARGAARDYIRQAREAGHDWDQIGRGLGLDLGERGEATPADAAFDYAAGPGRDPWESRYFTWTCRSCEHRVSDRGEIQHPADDQRGHAPDCARLAAETAEWNAQAERWAAEWEAGQ
jgi:hypothetical protein